MIIIAILRSFLVHSPQSSGCRAQHLRLLSSVALVLEHEAKCTELKHHEAAPVARTEAGWLC